MNTDKHRFLFKDSGIGLKIWQSLAVIATLIAGEFALAYGAGYFIEFENLSRSEEWGLMLVFRLVWVAVVLVYCRYIFRRPLSQVGLTPVNIKRGTIWGCAISMSFGIMVFSAVIVNKIFNIVGDGDLLKYLGVWGNGYTDKEGIAIKLLAVGLIGPVAEELVFRGMLYNSVKAKTGVVMAVLLSAGVFAGLHCLSLSGMFPLIPFIGGVLFAVAYEAGGSLMAPLIVHISGNAVLQVLSYY